MPEKRTEGGENHGEETPKIQPIRKPWSVTAVATGGLFVLALFYTLYFARTFFLPLTMAWMLSMLLSPLVRWLKKIHIPEPLGAAILLVALIGLLGLGARLLAGPAVNWVKKAPESFAKVESKIRKVSNSANELTKAAESVKQIAKNGDATETETPKVELQRPGFFNVVWTHAREPVFMVLEVFVLLYFLLATGDAFTLKLIQILPTLKDKKRAVEITRDTHKSISRYLGAITLVNAIEGTAIGTGLALIGMPNPLLWGFLAFSANYIPYLGAMIAGSIVTVVALVSFDSVGHALLAPLIYFGVNFTDNFLAPYVMGRRLVLNPLVVFMAVMFWGWLWGIPGVLLGVPLTMAIKIMCENNAVLAPFAEFLTAGKEEKAAEEMEAKAVLAKGNA